MTNSTGRPVTMQWARAFGLAAMAMGGAAVANALLYLLGGDPLVIPGELTIWHVIGFTLAVIPVVALLLRLAGRWYPAAVLIGTIVTLPFPFAEFGARIGVWLAAMHLVAGAAALLTWRRGLRS